MVARSLTRPIVQLTAAVEGAGRDGSATIPVDASGETGVLARAFARVIGEANAKTTALEREIEEHRRTEAARDRHRRSRAAVQRRGRIVPRRHRHEIAGRQDHRLESGGRTHVRIYRGGSGGPEYRSHRTARPAVRGARHPEPDRAGQRDRTARNGTIAQETAARWRFRSAYLRSRPRRARSSAHPRSPATSPKAKKTREALNRETEERQRIFETSQDLILVTDSQGVLVQVSPSSQAILGYAPEEMIGYNAIKFIYSDDLNDTRDEMRAARRRRSTREISTPASSTRTAVS